MSLIYDNDFRAPPTAWESRIYTVKNKVILKPKLYIVNEPPESP